MAHVYEVTTSNGERYTVTTREYHGDHHETTFRQHLLDILKGAAGGVISGSIMRFAYKGRR